MSRRHAAPRPPFLVVGAGAQGLTFALELAQRGERVVLAEATGELGGQARSFRYGGFTFDYGLHALVTHQPALTRRLKALLGKDFRAFRPRAASLLGGKLVEDTSSWCAAGLERELHELLPSPGEPWNCMRIAAPPPVVYPRRGGFGALCGRMARRFEALGGELRLRAPVPPEGLRVRGGRVVAAVMGGRERAVSGVYWAAGAARLAGRTEPEDGGALVLFHYRVRGAARAPYHWVRLDGATDPLLPRLVYFPAAFAPANAPAGAHGLGAVVPVPPAASAPPEARALLRWFRDAPGDFEPRVAARLEACGLLPADAPRRVSIERMPLPAPRAERAAHRFQGVSNLWEASDWAQDDARDSGVALQMRGALAAAEAALA